MATVLYSLSQILVFAPIVVAVVLFVKWIKKDVSISKDDEQGHYSMFKAVGVIFLKIIAPIFLFLFVESICILIGLELNTLAFHLS